MAGDLQTAEHLPGCPAAIRLLDPTTAEVKRMYVEPDLYLLASFTQVDCWGEYASSPTGICLEKTLP